MEQRYRWQELATYNSEVARGIVHTEDFRRRMAGEQAMFNADQQRIALEKGWIVVGASQPQEAPPK